MHIFNYFFITEEEKFSPIVFKTVCLSFFSSQGMGSINHWQMARFQHQFAYLKFLLQIELRNHMNNQSFPSLFLLKIINKLSTYSLNPCLSFKRLY